MAEDTGLGAQAHIGRKMRNIAPELWDEISGIFEIAIATGPPVLSHRIKGATVSPADERRVFMTDCHPVRIGNGILASAGISRDITEQTEMQAERCRVMLELQHRNKNMLSNVLALVSRARRDAGSDAGALDILAMRIKARSNTQKLFDPRKLVRGGYLRADPSGANGYLWPGACSLGWAAASIECARGCRAGSGRL